MMYRTIVADPPWDYADGFVTYDGPCTAQDKREKRPVQIEGRRALPYQSMTVPEIMDLYVQQWVDPEGANLFLWTTNRYLPAAFDVLGAWGAAYAQALVWVKDRRAPFVASVAPNHAEYLLVARWHGGAGWQGSLQSNVVEIAVNPRARRHSAKPEAFMDLVESVSPGPYLELFSRRARLGWDTWGDESLHGGEAA